jgi:hypothetical protein
MGILKYHPTSLISYERGWPRMHGTPCERSWEIATGKLSYNYPVLCKYPGITFCTRVRLPMFL